MTIPQLVRRVITLYVTSKTGNEAPFIKFL